MTQRCDTRKQGSWGHCKVCRLPITFSEIEQRAPGHLASEQHKAYLTPSALTPGSLFSVISLEGHGE